MMKSVSKSLQEPRSSENEYVHSSLFVDEVTKNKIQRHLTDINDHITEEDIRNIDTNITANPHRTNSLANSKADRPGI